VGRTSYGVNGIASPSASPLDTGGGGSSRRLSSPKLGGIVRSGSAASPSTKVGDGGRAIIGSGGSGISGGIAMTSISTVLRPMSATPMPGVNAKSAKWSAAAKASPPQKLRRDDSLKRSFAGVDDDGVMGHLGDWRPLCPADVVRAGNARTG